MSATVRALLVADSRNILRDDMLKYLMPYPIILGLALRWLIPFAQDGLQDQYDIVPLYPLLVSYFGTLIAPTISGLLIGFLLIDERDTGTLSAIEVTPFASYAYFAYRLTVPMALALVSTFIVIPLMGILQVDMASTLAIALLASLGAPIMSLVLVTFSANKVQGLAVMKAASLLMSAPFIAWFVPTPWQWLFGIFPSFWPVKAFWTAQAGGDWWWMMGAGVIVALIWLIPLLRHLPVTLRRRG
jgi:fluoroquinolone transport system permease protein